MYNHTHTLYSLKGATGAACNSLIGMYVMEGHEFSGQLMQNSPEKANDFRVRACTSSSLPS